MSSRGLLRILSLFQPRSHRSNPLLLPMPRREHSQPKRVSTVGQPAWCRRTGREVEVDATCARHARTPRNRLRIEGRNQEASPHRAMTATIWPDVQGTDPRDTKGLIPSLSCLVPKLSPSGCQPQSAFCDNRHQLPPARSGLVLLIRNPLENGEGV